MHTNMRARFRSAIFGVLGGILGVALLGATWATPRTWVRGELVTESIMNVHVRDNLTYLFDNLSAGAGLFRGLNIGTHPDDDKRRAKILLRQLDAAVLDNGIGLTNVSGLVADITVSGVGGLDTGTEAVSTWYKIWLILNPTTSAKGLLLQAAKKWTLDATYNSDDTTVEIRKATGTRTAVGQGFKPILSGKLEFIDAELIRVGAVAGNIQFDLYADSSSLPTGTSLATSDIMDASTIATSTQKIRFVFRTPYTVTAAVQYHLVATGSWTASDAVYIGWRCDTSAATYADGTRAQLEGGTWNNTGTTAHDFSFWTYITEGDVTPTMPSGYTARALLGYVFNNSSSDFVAFTARDRTTSTVAQAFVNTAATVPTLLDMSPYVPPVPVTFTAVTVLDAGAARLQRFGGVPYGYELDTTAPAILAADTTANLYAGAMLPVNIEYQGAYISQNVGNATSYVGQWTW